MYISLYYVAFYVVMTGLFSLAIYVLMYTLDPYAPDYQDRLKSPGKTKQQQQQGGKTIINQSLMPLNRLSVYLFRGDGVAGHLWRGGY